MAYKESSESLFTETFEIVFIFLFSSFMVITVDNNLFSAFAGIICGAIIGQKVAGSLFRTVSENPDLETQKNEK